MDIDGFKHTHPQKLSSDDLEELAQLDLPWLTQLASWANKHLTCSHCGQCTLRCEVLQQGGLDVGVVEEHYQLIMALPADRRSPAVVELVQEHPEMFQALRRCCFCGYCTAECETHMVAADRMREWRELFMLAGYMPPDDSKIVMVDNEWHIFSAYRAIYGIGYSEFVSLDRAAEHGPGLADTLFMPGCSLVSYAPDLTRAVGRWMTRAGLSWAISDDCCGSPLMSAGLFDRAAALRQHLLDRIREAGIKRIITVCPGCDEEYVGLMGNEIDIVPLPRLLLEYKNVPFRCEDETEDSEGIVPQSYTVFDSCHDRVDSRHGKAIRALLAYSYPQMQRLEMDHRRAATLCCGAGGAVASYDPAITERRVWRVIDEARSTEAQALITMCPTCTYTVAQACLKAPDDRGIPCLHYLEPLFGVTIDWRTVFTQLEDMWSGEYGPWLSSVFF